MSAARGGRTAPRERRTLVEGLVADLRKSIEESVIPIGGKLPSEAALTEKFGVSRTVVREAVAALRSQGLVEPRQGAGVFVLANRTAASLPFSGVDLEKLSSLLEMMELRVAVEAEAAALAATRRSPAQEVVIFEALHALERAAEAGTDTGEPDLAFHMAIARATNNPRFEQFLDVLGVRAIPRVWGYAEAADEVSKAFNAQLNSEHHKIAEAISAGDDSQARQLMREHLEAGLRRYRELRQSVM